LNVWILNHYAHGPDVPGGIRHYALGRILVQRGYQVTVLASDWHHLMKRRIRLQDGARYALEDIDGVNFVWLRTTPYQENDWRRILNWVSYTIRAVALGRKLASILPEIGEPDVIIGSSVHLLAVVAAYHLARHYHAHFVMEVRDLWPQTLVEMGTLGDRHPLTWLLRRLERFLYDRAKRIISLLPFAYRYMSSLGVPTDKVTWIPNGVDLSLYEGLTTAASEVDRAAFTVMYAGAHGVANALDVLIEAARIVQDRGREDIRFVLMGDGPEKPRLSAMAQRLQLRNIEFRDPLPKARVPSALVATDAFVLILRDVPLYKYGISPNKLFDYLAASRPIVFAGNSENNVVDEVHCGVSAPAADPSAVAEAVIGLADLPAEEREAMGQRGRAYVQQYHDYSVLARQLADTLEALNDEQAVGPGCQAAV